VGSKLTLIVVGLVLSCSIASAQAFYTPPVVSVPRVTVAPEIDGNLNEPVWAQAATLSDFILIGGRGMPRYPTEVRLIFDTNNLYIAARMYSADSSALKADASERDGPVYEDDCLAVLIDTDCQRLRCAELAINPGNTRFDAFDRDPAENFSWDTAVQVLEDGWSLELALPFRHGIPPRPGEAWLLGVARYAPGEAEASTWCLHHAEFVEPQALGTLIFAGPPLTAQIDDLGQLWLGGNTAWISVTNLGTDAAALKANVRVTGRDKYGHYFAAVKGELDPRSREQFQVPYRIAQDGDGTLLLSITDAEGHTAWRSGPYPVSTPAVMEPLEQTLDELTSAWMVWGRLPQGETRDTFGEKLDELTERWRYLDRRYQVREDLVRPQAMAMQIEAERLVQEAQALKAQIQAEVNQE